MDVGCKLIATKTFRTAVRSETAYGIKADYGVQNNVMRLLKCDTNRYAIEWFVGDENDPKGGYVDSAEIGIWTDKKKVTDYDGVFELPKEAVELLKLRGFDVSDVIEDNGN